MSQTPIFDQLCAEFLKQRKVSYQSLTTRTRSVAPFQPIAPVTPVQTLSDRLSNIDTQEIDMTKLKAS